MRLPVAIAALAVLASLGLGLGFGAGAAAAQPFQPFQGQSILGGRPNTPRAPWCLNATTGFERVEEDCSFGSFAACQRALGNPNNGYCTQTSLYAGPPPVSPRKKKRKVRRGPA